MRYIALFVLLIMLVVEASAQQFFPVKVNKKWGLMNADGKIVLPPNYNAIGEFKQFGYAVMQREGGVGMLNSQGKEIVPPIYDDLKTLDSTLISVMKDGNWRVINLQGKTVLEPGYGQVKIMDKQFLAFSLNHRWGVVDINGKNIAEPKYESVEIFKKDYFLTKLDGELGLLTKKGTVILHPSADEISIYNPDLFFFKTTKNSRWGAVNRQGDLVVANNFESFSKVDKNFLKLIGKRKAYLFSTYFNTILTQGDYETYYPFSNDYVIAKKQRLLGLIDECGTVNLQPRYHEIQAYAEGLFRVNLNGKWGVVDENDQVVIGFDYDYIAPMKDNYCVVIQNKKLGVANYLGKVVVPTHFDKIELETDRAKAYLKGALQVFNFNAASELSNVNQFDNFFTLKIGKAKEIDPSRRFNTENQYVLEKFEWFYSPTHDKWGLRRLDDGSVQIEPAFNEIRVQKELGLTLVGIEQFSNYDFDRTSYRFEMAYGLVNNDVGLLVKEVDLLDLRMSDFEKGLPTARCVFANGRYGLINRIGKVLIKNYGYIGEFNDGLARMSVKGKMSGSMKEKKHTLGKLHEFLSEMIAPAWCTDFTLYDKKFSQNAMVTCEGCSWGYIDTIGMEIIPDQYTFASDFVSEVAIVECEGKWGLVSKKAKELIPCNYDGVSFMEHTDNTIIRVYKKDEKYGLIDTLGQLCVDLKYDEIGSFYEGRLAVRYKGFWGFVNKDGIEVIPSRFNDVGNFSDGLATARIGNDWGYIDKMGEVEIDFKYSQAGNFIDGIAYAKMESQPFGYINKANNWVIEPQFPKAYDFNPFGVARVEEVIGKYYKTGIINKKGDIVVKPKFVTISPFDKNGLAVAAYGGVPTKFGIIDLNGKMVTTQHFGGIGQFNEGFANTMNKGGVGYINTEGQVEISNQFLKAGKFSEGKAFAQDAETGRYGYINQDGEWVIEPKFSRCLDFKDGKAVVFQGNKKAGLIDETGKFMIEPSINQMLIFSEGRGLVMDYSNGFYYITDQANIYDGFYEKAGKFENGIAVVKSEGRWGIINQKGIEIIPPKYDKIEAFENGYARVRISGFSGLTNLKGELIVQPDYEYISYAGEGLFRVEKDDKIGYYNMDGGCVWDLRE
ncbi:MAG: hypothetical protein ACJAVF_000460 [Paraglaciecola sp.]|jgi:hypothetical protein